MSDWTDSLQQATFRGLPFAVQGGDGAHGRRQAVHEYPFKDKPWVEDLGRDTRQFRISGFLITDSAVYGGGDVIGQLNAMISATETEGSGTLVHPVLGELTVSIPRGGFTHEMRWDTGRYFAITFTCIESGDREFPSSDDSTGDATDTSADDVDDAASDDYVTATTGPSNLFSEIDNALSKGAAVINRVASTASDWIGMVNGAAADATSLFNMLAPLSGNYGRYFAGRTTGFSTTMLTRSTTATVQSLISDGISLRATVAAAGAALQKAAAGNKPAVTASAAQGLVGALLGATANPSDAVRLLTKVANFYPAVPTGPSVQGQAESVVQTATGALFRRAALSGLARASALYQPSSADDAASVRDTVGGAIDDEIEVAGDDGNDESYVALRAMRAAVIQDLNTRGGALPSLVTLITNEPVPSLVLAQNTYQSAARADALVTQADPVHPAFMPTEFKALGA